MKKTKLLSLLLAMLLFVSVIPAYATTDISDIFFATDVHKNTTNLTNVLSAVKKNTDIGLVALGGDYEIAINSLNSTISSVFPNADKIFITGNHDESGSGYHKTGEAYNNERFVLFVISYEDFKKTTGSDALSNYLKTYSTNPATAGKPLFVLSHLPLHKKRGDNTNANKYAQLLNEAGKTIDITYLYGHNHTVEKTLYFKTKGESLTPEGGSAITLNFTYATAGYIKEGNGMAVKVNDDTIVFQRYSTSGKQDSAITVKRINPAQKQYDCTANGHVADSKTFEAQSKALLYVCKECKKECRERIGGDVDGDSLITAADARMTLRASVDLENLVDADYSASDADGNGIIDAGDARLILRKSVGLNDANIEWKLIPVDKNGKLIA